MKLLTFFHKVKRLVSRWVIKQVAHVDSNRYTALYCKHLRKYGMHIEGLPRYIATTVVFDGRDDYGLITLHEDCVISSEVQLLTHDYSIARGLQAIGKNNTTPQIDEVFLRPISIGKNTFVGARTLIMPGTTIGDNCIVGAGSVIKGNIPDNTIIFGNPAKPYAKTSEWAEKKYQEHGYIIED